MAMCLYVSQAVWWPCVFECFPGCVGAGGALNSGNHFAILPQSLGTKLAAWAMA